MTFEANYLNVSAENLELYARKMNPVLRLCSLLEENKPHMTNNLGMKEEENTVLCTK